MDTIFILNKSMSVVDMLSNNGDSPQSPFFDDKYIQEMNTGAETFEFTTISNARTNKYLVAGNYVAFKFNNKVKVFQILETEEEHQDILYKHCYCEIAGLELINDVIRAREIASANIRQFMEIALGDTSWKLGIVDAAINSVHTIKIDKPTNVYGLIQNNLNKYDIEIEYRFVMRHNRIIGKYIDVYRQRGKQTRKRFEYGVNVAGVSKKVDMSELVTALIGTGKNNIDFKSVEGAYPIIKPLNQDFVADDEAYKIWNNNGSHIVGVFKADTESPHELLKLTWNELQRRKQPKFTYDIDTEMLQGDEDEIYIGDTVYVIDNDYAPALHLSARVGKLEISFTDYTKNKCILTNFKDVKSGILSLETIQAIIDGKFPVTSENIADGAITEGKIDTQYLTTIKTDILLAGKVQTEELISDKADIKDLSAINASIENLKAKDLEVTGKVTATEADIKKLKAKDAEIDNIFAGNITADMMQTGAITAGSGVIANGAIGNAQISELNAAKISSGTVDTSKVTVSGPNSNLKISGNKLQVFDGIGANQVERVSLGDINGDGSKYGFLVRGADGQTIIMDENGVTNAGITDGSITNEKVNPDANIDGSKLNIDSVVTEINKDGSQSISGNKIEVDGTNLSTKLSNITISQTEDAKKISQNTADIKANQNSINLKVDEQTYLSDKSDMTTKLDKNTSEIGILKNEVSLKVEKTDVENAIDKATLSRADFIARNFLSTPLIVSDSTLPIYALSGIPNPPLGAVFNSYNQENNLIKNKEVSSNGTAWAIIIGYEFLKNTTDSDKKTTIENKVRQIADFMISNVSIGRFNSMDFRFIDTNHKYNKTSGNWEKSNYKEIYISTMWLQVKAMMYAYEILQDKKYLNLGLDVLDSLFNTHFYMNAGVQAKELPAFLEWASYEYLACDNLVANKRFSASTRQYANQMGYYIHQAIKDVIRVAGDNERTTPKGDKYKPSDILTGLKKYLKNAYENQNITAMPLGLPYGYFHRVQKPDGSYDYIPQNWDFIENTWGDSWFVGDVVTYTIYSFAACGLTDIAREYANNYYKLKVPTKDSKWSDRFSNSELLFYDRVDFNTGTHLPDDDSISITYTALFYEILKEIGLNEHVDSCCYTLAKHQINTLDNKDIDGGYSWDVSKDKVSIEFKSFGEIINSQFYKNLNITSFTSIDNRFSEIKVTTDAITSNISKNYYSKNDINSKGYQTSSQVQQTVNSLEVKFEESGGYNLIRNSAFKDGSNYWNQLRWDTSAGGSYGISVRQAGDEWTISNRNSLDAHVSNLPTSSKGMPLRAGFDSDMFKVRPNTTYTLICLLAGHRIAGMSIEMLCYDANGNRIMGDNNAAIITNLKDGGRNRSNWTKVKHTFTTQSEATTCHIRAFMNEWTGESNNAYMWMAEPLVIEGDKDVIWTPNSDEVYGGITSIDKDGITVKNSNANTYTQIDASSFSVNDNNGGTVAEFAKSSLIPNLKSGTINAENIYANNVASKSIEDTGSWTHIYVQGTYGNDNNTGTGWGSNLAFKTVQKAISIIPDIVNHHYMIHIGGPVSGFAIRGRSGAGVIEFRVEDDGVVNSFVEFDSCSNKIRISGNTNSKKGTLKQGIIIANCTMFDVGWISFRGPNWAHGSGSCNILIREGSRGYVRCNDLNGVTNGVIVESNSDVWFFGNQGSAITNYIGIGSYAILNMMSWGNDICPDYSSNMYADAGHARMYHINNEQGPNFVKTPSVGWNPSYTPTQRVSTWNFNSIWSDETLNGWGNKSELIQGYYSGWNTGRWTGYMQMSDGFSGIRNTISGGTNLSGRIYIQRRTSSGNSIGSKLCLYGSDGTLITNSTSIDRGQGVWIYLSSSIIQKIQSGAIKYFYLKADSNNASTYFKCESNPKIEITYTK